MGNGAVSHDYTESEQLDEAINSNVQKKPVASKEVSKSLDGDFNTVGSTPQMSEASSISKEQPVRSEAKESKQSDTRSVNSKTKKKVEIEEEVSEVSSSDDMEPVDVLLQFIPFYGQGDPANDSIVRSALSSLSIEDIDAKDEYGNTLLLLACQYRCEDLARIMINKGANPNAVNTAGASCLHFACYQDSSSLPIAKVLLQNGANPDVAESNYGCTPLHYCAGSGDLEFCKLILQYGAQINAYDYYNYTCVDYAREAGFHDCANFLQKKLDKTAVKFNQSTKTGGALKATQSFRNNETSYEDMSYWESHVDPDSGGKYYIHTKSGECLWEAELKERINAYSKQQNFREGGGGNSSSNNLLSMKFSSPLPADKPKISEAALISQATEARLIAFLSKHDPARLVDISSLIEKYKGKEQELLNDLCKQYKVQEDPEFKAFQDKLNELRSVVKQAHVAVTEVSMIDPLLLHDITQETRKKLEAQLQEEKADIKRKYEQMMDEEKNAYRSTISEKEGLIAKLQTEMDTIMRSKAQMESELSAFQTKLESIHKSDNSTQSQLHQELSALADENSALKQEIHSLKQEIYMRQEKVSTLEETLAKLTAGKEEMIARDQAMSAERMEQQRQREQQYHSELQALEAKYKNNELKLKSDINQMKNENIRIEKALRDEVDALKRAKDREIDELRRYVCFPIFNGVCSYLRYRNAYLFHILLNA
ncbi:hypothetical protein EON65_22680 [archaeon]|nr:MAG: hypothetical protein EON65_22680 [archaeon]